MSYGKDKEKKPVQQVKPEEKKPIKGVASKDDKKKTPEISSYAQIPDKTKMFLRKKKKKKEDGDNYSESGLV